MPTNLQGQKVHLRDLTEADLPLRAQWTADNELAALMGVDVEAEPFVSPEEELRNNRDWFARRRLSGALLLAIEAEGRVIGDVDVMLSFGDQLAELTIFIGDRTAWGKGYGTETVELLRRLFFSLTEKPIARLTVDVHAANERALRFFQRLGFTEYHTDEGGVHYLECVKTTGAVPRSGGE